jgi:hypothetical protein
MALAAYQSAVFSRTRSLRMLEAEEQATARIFATGAVPVQSRDLMICSEQE